MDEDRWDRYRRVQEPDWEPEPSPPPWLEYVERLLLHLTIIGLVVLVLVQMLLTQPPLRRLVVFADRLEGVDWEALLSRPELAGQMRYPGITGASGDTRTAPGAPEPGASGVGGATGLSAGPARPGAAGSSSPGGLEGAARTQDRTEPALGPVAEGRLTVMLISQPSAPGVYLLIDGRRAGDFGRGSVTVRVRAGQRVEVDGRGVLSALTFRVTAVEGLSEPRLGEQITTDGDLAVLGVAA